MTQAGWTASGTPLMPSRVTRHYAQVLGETGLVAADPGTGRLLGRAHLRHHPARIGVRAGRTRGGMGDGVRAGCSPGSRRCVRRWPWWTAGPGSGGAPCWQRRRGLGVGIGIEAWDEDEEPSTPEHHLARLDALVSPASSAQLQSTLATDPSQLAEMVDAAGPVRAWTGDERPPG